MKNDKTGHKRDRSDEAEDRRASRNIVMDFTGEQGLARSFIQHRILPPALPKPKRGWAAQRRASKFENYLPEDKMELARRRHKWRQKELAREHRA